MSELCSAVAIAEVKEIKVVESEGTLTLAGICRSDRGVGDRLDIGSTPMIYKAITEQLSGDLGGEAVVLSLKTGQYYGLNVLGARIWELVQNPTSLESIEATILAEFEVEPDECHAEVRSFISLLESEGLIEKVNDVVAEVPPTNES